MIAHISEDGRIQTIKEHTENVINIGIENGRELGIENIIKLTALVHDSGKCCEEFQKYICDKDLSKKGKIDHSYVGARWIMNTFEGEKSRRFLKEIMAYSVASHHGVFDIIDEDGINRFNLRIGKTDNYDESVRNADKEFVEGYDTKDIYEKACIEFDDVYNKLKIIHQKDNRKFCRNCFERLLLSVLIDADWTDTANFMENKERDEYSYSNIFCEALNSYNKYMNDIESESRDSKLTEKNVMINNLRKQINDETRRFSEYDNGIYCLPVPTGGGKTLSALGYALEYANKHKNVEHIFYISPFLSITEQNTNIIRNVINHDEWILEHHSNVVNSDDVEDENVGVYISWDKPFITTTMVQFFNTLFSSSKQSIRRFHQLKNSVIIIDEVQTLPVKTIHTFNLMMNFLKEICNCSIILCTATQPLLDKLERPIIFSDPKEMIEDVSNKFMKFDRVEIETLHIHKIYSYIEVKNFIKELFHKNINSALVILNSIYAVNTLYELVKEDCDEDIELIYLTTQLCPQHRIDKLKDIKQLLNNGKRVLIISTSLIEAGVDLSVECVIRSLTGLDSIAQAAGRCNRNGEMEKGKVYIINVDDERLQKMPQIIEAGKATLQVIDLYSKSDKNECLVSPKWMNEYYKAYFFRKQNEMDFNVKEFDTYDTLFKLFKSGFGQKEKDGQMFKAAVKTVGDNYKLIEDKNAFDVIVPYKNGIDIIDGIDCAQNCTDKRKMLRNVQRYMVSVRCYKKDELERRGIIRESENIPGVYIANSYEQDMGLLNKLLNLLF